jgi:hypothetical protein
VLFGNTDMISGLSVRCICDSTLVQLNETDKQHTLLFSPNPTTSGITFHIPDQFGHATTIEIYNMFGQILCSHAFQDNVDLGSLSSGIYFVVITNDKGEKISARLMKE